MDKINNILNFSDFEKNWKAEKASKTKRTDTGLDILKEDVLNERVNEVRIFQDILDELRTQTELLEKMSSGRPPRLGPG